MVVHPNVKVNLGLSVIRKRPDGFHELETLFAPYFGISDTLEIILGDGWSETSASLYARYSEDQLAQAISEDGKVMITIARREGVDWDPLKDLTVKAYQLLAEDFELKPVKIFLEKTSPVGAGLGGGSADAAFALRVLDGLFALGLSDESLAAYAARLGSDCAFFIYNRPMLGRGRGEVLEPFSLEGIDLSGNDSACAVPVGPSESENTGLGASNYLLKVIVPDGIAVSTAEAYRGITPREAMADCPYVPLMDALEKPVEAWKDVLVNDFETTVFSAHPELAAIKQSLYDSGAIYASMSGSGSALFAIY
ncbi:MAG: 4-(cytidine 5'-diphospho)-2-C-methyl-D-erythritol kinase [Bacteroidales bacterium]|nr:4-(cytidine 5'-diphospho)-2-C-methyl-D-erythritol kinase [Bacteroidales bacterium]